MSSFNNSNDGAAAEWFEHWSTMFPFATAATTDAPEEERRNVTNVVATPARYAAQPPPREERATVVMPPQLDSPEHRHQRELRQDLRRIEATFQKHLSNSFGENRTLRTESSTSDGEEEDHFDALAAFAAERNLSFTTERTVDESDDAFMILHHHYDSGDAVSSNKASKGSRSRKHAKRSHQRQRRKVKHGCDPTTKRLSVLVVILMIVVILLGALTLPRRNRNVGQDNNQLTGSGQQNTPSMAPDNEQMPTIDSLPPTSLRPKPRPTPQPTYPTDEGYYDPPFATPVDVVAPVAVVTAPSPPPTRPTNPNAPLPPVPPLTMGPLVGHVTHNSVNLWAYHQHFASNTNEKMELVVYDAFDGVLAVEFIEQNVKERNAGVYHYTLKGLQPSTHYKYGMHLQGQRVGQGHFTTAPKQGTADTFDYVLASCMNARQYRDQRVWSHIVSNNGDKYPDLAILAGDTVYLQEGVDVTEEAGVILDRVWFRNQEQRDDPYFKDFIARVPTYATWNDHEYGKNNASKDQKGKENSRNAWRNLWANPGYGDERQQDGIYYSFRHGDVHFIVTDDHWFRDYATGNRLGEKQTEWIRKELVESTATFKVIVIGSDIMERGWESDLNNIGRIVMDNRIEGVLFHAGDVHRNEFKAMEYPGVWPYKVTQITSSGIARVWRRPYVHIKVDTQVDDPTMTAHFFGATSTAGDTTWRNDPNLQCSSIVGTDRDKEHSCTETVRLSNLKVR